MNQPTFSIRDNGDGTATVFDGGVAVVTVRRDRGQWQTDSRDGHDYVTLAYVCAGQRVRTEGGEFLASPEFSVSVASTSHDVEQALPEADVRAMFGPARSVYVAGRVQNLHKWYAAGHYDADAAAELTEAIEMYGRNGEQDLADALTALQAEFSVQS